MDDNQATDPLSGPRPFAPPPAVDRPRNGVQQNDALGIGAAGVDHRPTGVPTPPGPNPFGRPAITEVGSNL
jgi:hypothetical protein